MALTLAFKLISISQTSTDEATLRAEAARILDYIRAHSFADDAYSDNDTKAIRSQQEILKRAEELFRLAQSTASNKEKDERIKELIELHMSYGGMFSGEDRDRCCCSSFSDLNTKTPIKKMIATLMKERLSAQDFQDFMTVLSVFITHKRGVRVFGKNIWTRPVNSAPFWSVMRYTSKNVREWIFDPMMHAGGRMINQKDSANQANGVRFIVRHESPEIVGQSRYDLAVQICVHELSPAYPDLNQIAHDKVVDKVKEILGDIALERAFFLPKEVVQSIRAKIRSGNPPSRSSSSREPFTDSSSYTYPTYSPEPLRQTDFRPTFMEATLQDTQNSMRGIDSYHVTNCRY